MLKWGIIGAGDIARKISARAIQDTPGSRLTAVMRTNLDRAQEFAKEYDAPKFYDTAEALINDPDVDAVYLSTPVHLHYEHTLLAAKAGKHVMVEKPMALREADCAQMIEACSHSGVELMVLFYQRFNALHQNLRRMLAEGLLGRVTLARSQFTQLGAPGPVEPKWDWRLDPRRSGGGTLMDTGSHCVDTLRYVLGHEVVKVCALSGTVLFNYAVDDTTSFLMQFDDGAQAVVSSSWSSPDWDQAAVNVLEVYGDKGCAMTSAVNNKLSHGDLRWNIGHGWQKLNAEQNTHMAAFDAFRTSIENRTEPPVTGVDGLINTKILMALYESARQNRHISITY